MICQLLSCKGLVLSFAKNVPAHALQTSTKEVWIPLYADDISLVCHDILDSRQGHNELHISVLGPHNQHPKDSHARSRQRYCRHNHFAWGSMFDGVSLWKTFAAFSTSDCTISAEIKRIQ